MRKLFLLTLFFAVITAIPGLNGTATTEENVTVTFEYLTDSDGYNYGADWFVSSTVNDTVCVVPKITSRNNVDGDVVSPFPLGRNESHFRIGSFRVRDSSKEWSVLVTAKWHRGNC